MSLYLLIKHRSWLVSLAGIASVAVICQYLADPVPGVGYRPASARSCRHDRERRLLLAYRQARPLAYVSGCIGTLIGADLLKSRQVARLGRADRPDRRRGDIRRDIFDRHPGRLDRECLASDR